MNMLQMLSIQLNLQWTWTIPLNTFTCEFWHTLTPFPVLLCSSFNSGSLFCYCFSFFLILSSRFKDQTVQATHRWAALCSAALVWALVLIALSLAVYVPRLELHAQHPHRLLVQRPYEPNTFEWEIRFTLEPTVE